MTKTILTVFETRCITVTKTCDHEVASSTAGRVVIKWLVLGWLTVCGEVNKLDIQPTPGPTRFSIFQGRQIEYRFVWLGLYIFYS